MTLTSTADLVAGARTRGRAVLAFNVITLEHAEAVAAGAERAGQPVILQVSQNAVRYHGGSPRPLVAATAEVARAAASPVAVHLDHVDDPALVDDDVIDGLAALGLSSVMYDASGLDYDHNVAATRAVADRLRSRGLAVEAELGEVGGKDGDHRGAHDPGARTDPVEAAGFVAATGVDALAVAVGSSHAMTTRTARLDLDLIARIAAAVPVPLVLHGSSGVAPAHLADAARAGITKINVGTALNVTFTAAVRAVLGEQPAVIDPRRYLAPARDAVAVEVAALFGALAS